jgi:DNA-binding NtrC family response regulator
MACILHVDDNEQLRSLLRSVLQSRGHEVVSAPDGAEGLVRFRERAFDVVVSDIQMPVMDGLQFLEAVMRERPETPVIMATSVDTIKTALNALQIGAFDYVLKPFKLPVLIDTVQRAAASERTQSAGVPSEQTMSGYYALPGVVAVSERMRSACEAVRRVAPLKTPHLIAGEAGTGRKLLAQSIHALSPRRGGPFVRYSCRPRGPAGVRPPFIAMLRGPTPERKGQLGGALMEASGGTLLIEDVEALPLEFQDLLLELIHTGTICCETVVAVPRDVRILATTQHDLRGPAAEGAVRGELVELLTRMPIVTAPLHDRTGDILPLAWHMLLALAGERKKVPAIARGAQSALEHYAWPGNVEELAGAVRHAFGRRATGVLGVVDLPAAIAESLENLALRDAYRDDAQERGQAFRQRLAEKLAERLDERTVPAGASRVAPLPGTTPTNLPGPEAEGKPGAYVLPGPDGAGTPLKRDSLAFLRPPPEPAPTPLPSRAPPPPAPQPPRPPLRQAVEPLSTGGAGFFSRLRSALRRWVGRGAVVMVVTCVLGCGTRGSGTVLKITVGGRAPATPLA